MTERIALQTWRDLLRQGVEPAHILSQAKSHEKSLRTLKPSAEREDAIQETVSFIQEVEKLVKDD